jgi:hypothetical protein
MNTAALLATVLAVVPWPPKYSGPTSDYMATDHVEHHVLGKLGGDVRLEVDVVPRRIVLRGVGAQAASVAQRLSVSEMCGDAHARAGAVEAACVPRRLNATLTRRGEWTVLELSVPRGVPMNVPGWHAPSLATVWAQDAQCKSMSQLERARCHIKRGRLDSAIAMLARLQVDVATRGIASTMLAEIAVMQGHPARALGWYKRAREDSVWLLASRVGECELTARCEPVFAGWTASADALPKALQPVVHLRRMRAMALLLSPQRGAQELAQMMERNTEDPPCNVAWGLCHAIMGNAMVEASMEELPEVLDAYLRVVADGAPSKLETPVALRAAQGMEDLGVPLLAGRVRAAQTPHVPKASLEDHLYATTMDFMLAEDEPRARVLMEYVAQRFGPARLKQRRWVELVERLPSNNGIEGETQATRLAKARARAQLELVTATTLTEAATRVTVPGEEPSPQ